MSTSEKSLIPLQHLENKCDSFITRLSEFEEEHVIKRVNCKFCNHPARKEAEEHYERTGSYAPVQRFFDDYHEKHPDTPKMSFRNLKGHLDHHYDQQQKKLQISEYCKFLNDIIRERREREISLDTLYSSAEIKYYEIMADNLMDKAKQIDSVTKLGKLLIDIHKCQTEAGRDVKPVNILIDKVTNVWHHAITSEEDPKVQRRLLEVLDLFQNEMQKTQLANEQKV